MTDNNLITPPPELVEQWYEAIDNSSTSWKQGLATQAARWGADQELEACCEAFEDIWDQEDAVTLNGFLRGIRAARRPKPKSQAEEAIAELDGIATCFLAAFGGDLKCGIIRAALERLRELEGNQ